MGNLSWFGLGACATTICTLAGAQAAGSPSPAHVAPGAAAAFPAESATPLPPPPPVPSPAPVVAPPPVVAPVPAASPQPTAYPAPYPAAPYPGYPPPIPYGYYYPQPLATPTLRFPDDSAVRTSPFFDIVLAGVSWKDRVSQALTVGAQLGVYLSGHLRLAVRAVVPSENVNDQSGFDTSLEGVRYVRFPSNAPAMVYGASAGVVAYRTQNFAFAPGLAFARSDVSDYGTMVAVSLPLDWVMASGMRIGLELELGQAVGGSLRYRCMDGIGVACGGPDRVDRNRASGPAFLMQFQIGFGLNHPSPLPPSVPRRSAN